MKICVYAICKNEEQFVDRWYRSMSEADAVVVLDTGSTDGSVRRLLDLGAVVKQQIVDPWRFDVARNASMELIPPDTDICVCTDLDEFFEPGWRRLLEAAWLPGTTQARYRYTWNFNPDGSEGTVFLMEKTHAYGMFRWKHPVHEVLTYTGTLPQRTVTVQGIQLNHRADPAKSRTSYLPLLELAVKEEPLDDRNVHYLGREYMYRCRWDDAIATLQQHLALPTALWADERAASMRYIGRCFLQKGQPELAKPWYYRSIAEAPHLREPYVELAQLLYAEGNWDGVIYLCRAALDIADRPVSYICEAAAWGALPWDLASLGYYHTGRLQLAEECVQKAIALNPLDPRLGENLKIIRSKCIKAE